MWRHQSCTARAGRGQQGRARGPSTDSWQTARHPGLQRTQQLACEPEAALPAAASAATPSGPGTPFLSPAAALEHARACLNVTAVRRGFRVQACSESGALLQCCPQRGGSSGWRRAEVRTYMNAAPLGLSNGSCTLIHLNPVTRPHETFLGSTDHSSPAAESRLRPAEPAPSVAQVEVASKCLSHLKIHSPSGAC